MASMEDSTVVTGRHVAILIRLGVLGGLSNLIKSFDNIMSRPAWQVAGSAVLLGAAAGGLIPVLGLGKAALVKYLGSKTLATGVVAQVPTVAASGAINGATTAGIAYAGAKVVHLIFKDDIREQGIVQQSREIREREAEIYHAALEQVKHQEFKTPGAIAEEAALLANLDRWREVTADQSEISSDDPTAAEYSSLETPEDAADTGASRWTSFRRVLTVTRIFSSGDS